MTSSKLTFHNEFITLITTEQRLAEALTLLDESLFKAENTGYEFFHRVVTERSNFHHVHVSCMVTPKRYVNMELACSRCGKYVARELDSRHATLAELQEIRATLFSFITGCKYTQPGSDAPPQR